MRHGFVLSALAVEKTANLSLRVTLDKLFAEENSEFHTVQAAARC